jgi:hypothetical protein
VLLCATVESPSLLRNPLGSHMREREREGGDKGMITKAHDVSTHEARSGSGPR